MSPILARRELMSASGKSSQWYWMPTLVFLFGMLSIFLLLWVARISVRLQNDEVLVDAVMDVQIRAATYHLRLEETLSGVASTDAEETVVVLDQAIHLADLSLNGGEAEYGRILEPLEDPELRFRVEVIRSLLLKLKAIGFQRLQLGKAAADSVLERHFDSVFKETLVEARELEDILERDEAVNQKRSRLLFLAITVVWLLIVVVAAGGLWRRERQRDVARKKLLKANEQLLVQKEELTEHREHLERLVEKRTAALSAANDLLLAEINERLKACETLKESEQQIRQLSSRLLGAQEIERKRISMELHDELGQALNVMKLRVRVVERGLRTDQGSMRADCEGLLEYMDQIIEDVRRLSLNLSPTVLEDLGLTSALQWLVSNLTKMPGIKTTADITEIDHLFHRNHWITIYRVIQESLTNIVKHAQAEKVSVNIRRQDHKVVFCLDDDGIGFDPEQAFAHETPDKGFGLSTMSERVRMLGGVFDLWSREGKGTRITFSIPIDEGVT